MRTKLDPDDEFFIPEVEIDWSIARPSPFARKPGERTEICLDGAIEYQLRLIPSTKVIGRFTSTLDAWPEIIAAIDSGRSPRTLSFDAIGAAGQRWHMAAGPFLERFARLNNGEPHPYTTGLDHPRRRVAEGAESSEVAT